MAYALPADTRLLVIDDTPAIRALLRIALPAHGVHIDDAATACAGLAKARALAPDAVVLDLDLPDRHGLDLLPDLLALPHPPVVVVLSACQTAGTRELALTLGASGYVTKPFIVEDLLDVLHEHMYQHLRPMHAIARLRQRHAALTSGIMAT